MTARADFVTFRPVTPDCQPPSPPAAAPSAMLRACFPLSLWERGTEGER